MKRVINKVFFLILLSSTGPALAEFWGSSVNSGETIYLTGYYDQLIVGQRGAGFKTVKVLHNPQSATLKIDSDNPFTADIQGLNFGRAYFFTNSKKILPLILNAKRIELSFNTCGHAATSSATDCLFTSKGEPYSTVWEFDKPLNASFDTNALLPK